ncbi:MAG: hypothetical protein JWM89_2980 [Acidimicrobiales bacterium]|nr:hypothetical protein [Acidimicrobiales bacterium]
MQLSISDLAHLATYAYLVIAGVAAGDAIVPVLPAETLVILGGVLAASGDLSLGLVILAATVGAVVGDNISYQIGRVANRNGRTPEEMSGRFGKALGWAEAALAARGSSMLVIGRFIPGGRTALSFGAGYVRFSRARFAVTSLFAAAIWASYSAVIGLVGGRIFAEHWWAGLGLGLAVTGVVTGLIELGRKVSGRGTSIADKRVELRDARLARMDRRSNKAEPTES